MADSKTKAYDGVDDAEWILERVMKRRNYGFDVRDSLAESLVEVREGRNLSPIKRQNNDRRKAG